MVLIHDRQNIEHLLYFFVNKGKEKYIVNSKETQTQKKLIEVAIELFSTNGFKGTSIRNIAKTMGMTISNIYYYYDNKYGLLLAVLEHLSMDLMEQLQRITKMDSDPLDRFKLLVTTHLDNIARDKNKASLFFLDEEALSPAGNEINKQFQLSILNIYRQELQNLRDAGYIKYKNITVLAFNVIGVIQWHLRWYRPGGKLSIEEVKKEALNFILNGLLWNSSVASGTRSSKPTRR
jgi:AcrR family transcriptional regulator